MSAWSTQARPSALKLQPVVSLTLWLKSKQSRALPQLHSLSSGLYIQLSVVPFLRGSCKTSQCCWCSTFLLATSPTNLGEKTKANQETIMASVTRPPTLKQIQHAENPELGKSRLSQYRNLLARNKEIPNCQPDLFYWGFSLYLESQGGDSTGHLQKSGMKSLSGEAAAALGRCAVLRTAQREDSAAPRGKPACASGGVGCHRETQRRCHFSRRNDESQARPLSRHGRAVRAGTGVGAVWPYLG